MQLTKNYHTSSDEDLEILLFLLFFEWKISILCLSLLKRQRHNTPKPQSTETRGTITATGLRRSPLAPEVPEHFSSMIFLATTPFLTHPKRPSNPRLRGPDYIPKQKKERNTENTWSLQGDENRGKFSIRKGGETTSHRTENTGMCTKYYGGLANRV